MSRLSGTRLPNPSRETQISAANGDREIFIFPDELTTSRIGNLTRLIHTLAICVTMHTYMVGNPVCGQLDKNMKFFPVPVHT